jgi:hypothetical protein
MADEVPVCTYTFFKMEISQLLLLFLPTLATTIVIRFEFPCMVVLCMYTIVYESRLVSFANLSFKNRWENGALLTLLFDFSQSVPVGIGAAFG